MLSLPLRRSDQDSDHDCGFLCKVMFSQISTVFFLHATKTLNRFDIIAGVDELVELGIADEDKLVIGGWSYGGYMANWAITQTNRFKASVSVAGVSNLVSLYGQHEFSISNPIQFKSVLMNWLEWSDKHIEKQ